MRIARIGWALTAATLMAATPALAEHVWSNADLEGAYTLSGSPYGGAGTGRLVFDGAGLVSSGSLLVLRSPHGGSGVVEHLEETLVSGTYSIGPDGRGRIDVTWTPTVSRWLTYGCMEETWQPNETYFFTFRPDGFDFITEFVTVTTDQCGNSPPRSNTYLGGGRMDRQVPCGPSMRRPPR